MAALSEEQFAATHAKLASRGGFTVDPHTGEDITSGISVAPRDNERKVALASSTPGTLADYAADNAERFGPGAGVPNAGKNASLGGWRSEDNDFYDTPTVYKNTSRGERSARKHMVLAGQEAAFDLDNFQEKFNPFHEEGRRKAGMEPHELAVSGRSREAADWLMKQPEVQAWVQSPGRLRGRRSGPGSS